MENKTEADYKTQLTLAIATYDYGERLIAPAETNRKQELHIYSNNMLM